MRTSLALPLLLCSCDGAGVAKGAPAIECAVDGAASFEPSCTLEREGATLIVHHPDGGFRRLEAAPGGVAPADGADPALVAALPDGRLEVTVAGDRYRLPAGTGGR